MHLSQFATDTFWTLLFALPAGLGLAARCRKGAGETEESVTAYQLLIESNFDGVLSMDVDGIITWADNQYACYRNTIEIVDAMGQFVAEAGLWQQDDQGKRVALPVRGFEHDFK